MTSLEIAELTGKLHKNVLRDIATMLEDLYPAKLENAGSDLSHVGSSYVKLENDGSDLSHVGLTEVKDARGYTASFTLDEDHVMTLVTGYSVKLRHTVVQAFRQLTLKSAKQDVEIAKLRNEASQLRLEADLAETESAKQKATQAAMAESAKVFQAHQAMMLEKNPNTPSHLLQTEAAKQVLQQTGVNLSRPMTSSPAMDSVAEIWLSPSQMGKLLGYRNTDYRAVGLAVNLQLNKLGLQRLSNTQEESQLGKYCPTELGQKYTNIHAWLSDMTTGFNLKWSPSVLDAFRFARVNEFSEAEQYDPSTDGENEAWFYEHAAMAANLSAPQPPVGRWSHLV